MLGKTAISGRTIVVDIGKTHAKVSLWNDAGQPIRRERRANERTAAAAGYRTLDVEGIDAWLMASIRGFAADGAVARVVTVAHGAAAALIRDGALFTEPMDYEIEVGPTDRADYEAQRDPFEKTGSPSLPHGLNLGVQLHLLEKWLGPLPADVVIVPWPQYWAWRFSGVPASEITSLGCHSDLWRPTEASYSRLAVDRGWAARMAPLRPAGATLGTISTEVAEATGLNRDCRVLCGLHDSNAALLAARGHPEIADNEATVLSTGTWFVAMRCAGNGTGVDIGMLRESRDCLVNVDVYGRPIPSARFMGGREAELAGGVDSFRLTDSNRPDELLNRLPKLVERGVAATPGFVPGVGPFPNAAGSWREKPNDPMDLRAATDLYLALVADTVLDLICSRERLLVEGRFANEVAFVRALAALRPDQRIYTSHAEHDVAYGALRLIDPGLRPSSALLSVEPMEIDMRSYAADWRRQAESAQEAA